MAGDPLEAARAPVAGNDGNALSSSILDISIAVLQGKDEGMMLEVIGRSMMSLFPVKRLAIYTTDMSTGDWRVRFVAGYPPDQAREMMSVSYSKDSWEETLRISKKVGSLSYHAFGEYIVLEDFDSAFYWHLPREAPPRPSPEHWHTYDFVDTILFDNKGRELGAIEVLETTDGRLLSAEVVSQIEILASIASMALELSRVWKSRETLLEANGSRARVLAHMLDTMARLVSTRGRERILTAAAEFLADELAFENARAAVWSRTHGRYVFLSPEGAEDSGTTITKETFEQDCDDTFRFTEELYWIPSAQLLSDRPSHPPFTEAGAKRIRAVAQGDGLDPVEGPGLDLFVFPLRDRSDEVVATIYATDRREDGMFEKDLLEVMGLFGSMLSLAFRNNQLIREIVQGNEDLDTVNRLLFHDISSYNTGIGSYLDLATSPDAPPELKEKALAMAGRHLEMSNDLISRVRKLMFIREKGRERMLPVDLVSTIASLVEEMRASSADRRLDVTLSAEESQCLIMGNDLLHDLFRNLLSNAVKHCPGEVAKVDISVRGASEGPKRLWEVTVSDRGGGIPDGDKERVFERFALRGSGGKGTSLGLSIVRSIVDAYGGRVWVEDRVAGDHSSGAAFHVQLPAA